MKVKKPRPPYNQNSAIRSALRRSFSRSPIVREVLQEHRRTVPRFNKDGSRHKVDSVQNQCGVCANWVAGKIISVDHIIPVIDITEGYVDWNVYVDRLWCEKANLQPICDPCHQTKTNAEREARNTIKYNAELDALEKNWKQMDPTLIRKALIKCAGKKKPQVIRDRAKALKEKL